MQRKFHRRHIAFNDKETFLNFANAYGFLFSNGGAHTNRMFFDEKEDVDKHRIYDIRRNKTYYILCFICDSGTWDYIRACHKFDRVSIWYKFSSILSPGYTFSSRSYVHYVGETDES